MDRVVSFLLALLSALGAVVGGTPDEMSMPDRPAIVAPTVTSEIEFRGLVESIDSDSIVVGGTRIRIDSSTRVRGILAVGVQVEIEGTQGADGAILAHTIVVENGAALSSSSSSSRASSRSSSSSASSSSSSSSRESSRSSSSESSYSSSSESSRSSSSESSRSSSTPSGEK